MSAEIVRVWGRADEIDLVFRHISGNGWAVNVPPDLSDGQYACEIHAENNYGERAMWTGILYMSAGVCCLKINAQRYVLSLLPSALSMQPLTHGKHIVMLPVDINAELLTQRISIDLWRCSHG